MSEESDPVPEYLRQISDEELAGEIGGTMSAELLIEPPERLAYETLLAQGVLKYGGRITWEQLSPLFGMPYNPACWKWRARYLAFCRMAKGKGYFMTEKDMDGKGVRVRMREELEAVVRQREKNKADDSLFTSMALGAVPRDGMTPDQIKGLDHWEAKTAVVGATAKILLKRRTLPNPANTAKTVGEILRLKLPRADGSPPPSSVPSST